MLARLLGKLSYVFIAAGAALLIWCGFVLVQAHVYQTREKQQFISMLQAPKPKTRPRKIHTATATRPLPENGAVLGELEIPRLGIDTLIFQGDDAKVLRWGVGHIPGTPMPDGDSGNVGLAAHRDSYFRPLRHIHGNDLIIVKTTQGSERYQVKSTKVVSPDDVAVLDNTRDRTLTLVTCYPFYYIGSAPKRFIVQARVVDSKPQAGS